jgi:hypothetical protein
MANTIEDINLRLNALWTILSLVSEENVVETVDVMKDVPDPGKITFTIVVDRDWRDHGIVEDDRSIE